MTLDDRLREAISSVDRAVTSHGRKQMPRFGRRETIRRTSMVLAALALAGLVGLPMIRELGSTRVKTADRPKEEQKQEQPSENGGEGAPTKPRSGSAPGAGLSGKSGSSSTTRGAEGGASPPTSLASISERIVFVSQRGGDHDIFVMNGDGSGQTRLTNDGNQDVAPSWAPDCRTIVFQRGLGVQGDAEIFTMKGDGTGQRRLRSASPGCCGSPGDRGADPVFSADGGTIAYVANTPNASGGSQFQIWSMDVDGSNPRQITFGAHSQSPAWSPDGSRIAFVRWLPNQAPRLWTMNADGSDDRLLSQSEGWDLWPSWSPDGRHLVFTNGHNLYTMTSGGGDRKRLTNTDAFDSEPSWSHDGSRIVFARDPDGHHGFACGGGITTDGNTFQCPYTTGPVPPSIWTINPDGRGLRQLTSSTTIDWSPSFNTFAR